MSTTTSNNVLTIDPSRLFDLETKITKLNRRAVKLGLNPVEYTLAERVVQVPVDDHSGYPTGLCREVVVVDVTLTGNAPKLNGWTLICKVEHTESGQLVTQPAGCKEDLSAWYECSGRDCDHCHTNRDRKETFVLRDESGKSIRIGRSCLADYVRSEDAVAVANAALWGDFFPPSDEDHCGFGFGCQYSVLQIVSFAVAAIRVTGCYTKGDTGTREDVGFAINAPFGMPPSAFEMWKKLQPTADDAKRAGLIVEWGKNAQGGDYLHNLSVACKLLSCGSARNLLISAPSAYAHANEQTVTTTSLPKVLPPVGRYPITGVVKTLRNQESDWGTVMKMLLVVSNETGTWNGWCTVPNTLLNTPRVVEGDEITLTATVAPKEPGFAILSRPSKAIKTRQLSLV